MTRITQFSRVTGRKTLVDRLFVPDESLCSTSNSITFTEFPIPKRRLQL